MTNTIEWRSHWAVAVLMALAGLCSSAAALAAEPAPLHGYTELHAADRTDGSARYFRITASSGFDFSAGDFGTDTDSDVWYLPTSLKVEWDPFFIKVTVPYVIADGVILIGGQPEAAPGLGSSRGIGDVILSVGYVYFPTAKWVPVIELSGKVKLATADEDKGLGTGEEDYALRLDVSKRFGRFTPFGTVGYKFIGDPPGVDLNDKIFASVGFSARLGDWVSAGVVYDWAESAVSGRPDIHEVSPFASFRIHRNFSIDPYALVGLTSSAPDWGLGVQFRVFWAND